jgi:REP element-mobilizing transposase RayT
MSRARQSQPALLKLPRRRPAYGGKLVKGHRKEARPFAPDQALHVVFKSNRARGDWSLLAKRNRRPVEHKLRAIADRHGIEVYQYVNVGNHLHLLIKTRSRRYWIAKAALAAFLRHVAGAIAMHVTNGHKGNAKGRFWEELVYTRIVWFGRMFKRVKEYLVQNLYEAEGLGRVPEAEWLAFIQDMAAAGVGPPN